MKYAAGVVLAVMLAVTTVAYAAEHEGVSDAAKAATSDKVALQRASDLIGASVYGSQHEDIGKIEDLVLAPNSSDISYAVLSFGGIAGIGDKYFAVPWKALTHNVIEGTFALPVDKQVLENAPGFDKANWPDMANARWMREVDSYYKFKRDEAAYRAVGDYERARAARQQERDAETSSYGETATEEATALTEKMKEEHKAAIEHRRLSSLMGTTVENPGGDDIATLKDVLVDVTSGQVPYALVSYGGFWSMGESLAAVPFPAIQMITAENRLTIAATKEQLEASKIDEGSLVSLENEDLGRTLYSRFDVPFWTDAQRSIVAQRERERAQTPGVQPLPQSSPAQR